MKTNRIRKYLIILLIALCAVCACLAVACGGSVTLKFKTNGGDKVPNIKAEVGEEVVLPDAERDGYYFEGWYLDESLTGASYAAGDTFLATENTTFYADWSEARTVYLDLDGGSLADGTDSVVMKIGGRISDSLSGIVPVKSGYEFGCWAYGDTSSTALGENEVMGDEDITLKAIWKISYTANIYLQNTSLDGYEKAGAATGYEYAYSFSGEKFLPDIDEYGFTLSTSLSSSIELSATKNSVDLYYDRNVSTVVFMPNGGQGSNVSRSGVVYGVGTEIDVYFTRSGYVLAGWSTSASGDIVYKSDYIDMNLYGSSGTEKPVMDDIAGNTTLYAVWLRAYEDFYGGTDTLYLYDESTIYLLRGGIFFGGEAEENRSGQTAFTFRNVSGKSVLNGILLDNYLFSYEHTEMTESSGYYLYTYNYNDEDGFFTYIYDNKLYSSYKMDVTVYLHFGAYNDVTMTVQQVSGASTDVSNGTYTYSSDGIYTAHFTDGLMAGQDVSFILAYTTYYTSSGSTAYEYLFVPYYQEDADLGTVYRFVYADSGDTGYWTYYLSAYSLTFTGYNTALYYYDSSYMTVYFYREGSHVMLFSYSSYYGYSYFGELEIMTKSIFGTPVQGYLVYYEDYDVYVTAGDGSSITMDGYSEVTYRDKSGVSHTGEYVISYYPIAGYTLSLYESDALTYKFALTISGGVIAGFSPMSLDYDEFYFYNDGAIYYSAYIVLDGEGYAYLYGVDTSGYYVLMSSGTYKKYTGDKYASAYVYTAVSVAEGAENYDLLGSIEGTELYNIKEMIFSTDTESFSYKIYTCLEYTMFSENDEGKTSVDFTTTYTTDYVYEYESDDFQSVLDYVGSSIDVSSLTGVRFEEHYTLITAAGGNYVEYSMYYGYYVTYNTGETAPIWTSGVTAYTGYLYTEDGYGTYIAYVTSDTAAGYIYYRLDENTLTFDYLYSYYPYYFYGDTSAMIYMYQSYITGEVFYTLYYTDEDGEEQAIEGTLTAKEDKDGNYVRTEFGSYIYSFTDTEGKELFDVFTISGTYYYVEVIEANADGSYVNKYTSSDGATFEVDTAGVFALYTDKDGNEYGAWTFTVDSNGIIYMYTDGDYAYIRLDGDNMTFEVLGSEFLHSYLLVNNNMAENYIVELDGLGGLTLYDLSTGDEIETTSGSYTLDGDRISLSWTIGLDSYSFEGYISTWTYAGMYYSYYAIITEHSEFVISLACGDDLTVMTMDGTGGAVMYLGDGTSETGYYTILSDSYIHYINAAGTDAAIYRYDMSARSMTPQEYSYRYYFSENFESVVFNEYGVVSFFGLNIGYYTVSGGTYTLYIPATYSVTGYNDNGYGYLEISCGLGSSETYTCLSEEYKGTVLYRSSTGYLTFSRTAENDGLYPVLGYAFDEIMMTPTASEFSDLACYIYYNGSRVTLYMTRYMDDSGDYVTYGYVYNYYDVYYFGLDLSYKVDGDSFRCEYSITYMGCNMLVMPYVYEYYNYYYYYLYGSTYPNYWGYMYVDYTIDEDGTCLYDEDSIKITGAFGASIGMINNNGYNLEITDETEIISVAYVAPTTGYYGAIYIRFRDTREEKGDNLVYEMYLYTTDSYYYYFGCMVYEIYYCTRVDTVEVDVGGDTYSVEISLFIATDYSTSMERGDLFSVAVLDSENEYISGYALVSFGHYEDDEFVIEGYYFITREYGEDGSLLSTTYYKLADFKQADYDPEDEDISAYFVPEYIGLTFEIISSVISYTTEPDTEGNCDVADFDENMNVLYLFIGSYYYRADTTEKVETTEDGDWYMVTILGHDEVYFYVCVYETDEGNTYVSMYEIDVEPDDAEDIAA